MPTATSLPEWATEKTPPAYTDGRPVHRRIAVDSSAMYPAILEEYAEYYSEDRNIPGEWKKADGDLRKEWEECLEKLDPEEPSAYWAEVAYQTAKMDLQIACRSFRLVISMSDAPDYAQQALEPGRGADKASGGLDGGKEAREHYKRLRGFLPG